MKKYHATSHIDANPFHSKHNKGYNLPKNSGWVRANQSTYGMKVFSKLFSLILSICFSQITIFLR